VSTRDAAVRISCYCPDAAKESRKSIFFRSSLQLDNGIAFVKNEHFARKMDTISGLFSYIENVMENEAENLCGEAGGFITVNGFSILYRAGNTNTTLKAGHRASTSAGRENSVLPFFFGWSGSHASAGRNRRCSTLLYVQAVYGKKTSARRDESLVQPFVFGWNGSHASAGRNRRCSTHLFVQAGLENTPSTERNRFLDQPFAFEWDGSHASAGRNRRCSIQTFSMTSLTEATSAGRKQPTDWPLEGVAEALQVSSLKGGRETGMRARIGRILSLAAFVAAAHLSVAAAATLSTNYADMTVDNLKPGGVYNLTEVANFPMWVGYRGDDAMDVMIEPMAPLANDLKQGYQPIPDPSWIGVSKNRLSLLPDESENLDVTISIPNDARYLGKKYQAYLYVASVQPDGTQGGLAVLLALKGRILFSIASAPATEEELIELKKKKVRATQGVIITPERFETNIPKIGVKANVTEYEPLKLINSSREKVALTLEAVEPDASGISLPRGFEKGGLKDITFSKTKMTMKPDSIENITVSLQATKKEAKKLFYAVKVGMKSETMNVVKFVRIYATQEIDNEQK
jgi:hypothetical protein